jgi:hypothetical protein
MNSIKYIFCGFRTMSALFYTNCLTIEGSVDHNMFCNFGFSSIFITTIRDSLCRHNHLMSCGLIGSDDVSDVVTFPFNSWERDQVPCNFLYLIGHMSMLFSALAWLNHYIIAPTSFPWAIVGILSKDPAKVAVTMDRLKVFFNLLVLIECSDFPFRSTAISICTIFHWQMLREMCEVAALTDFRVSERLTALVRGFYQVGTTLSLENTFNDLRDVERRSRKSLTVSLDEMQTVQIRALSNRYELPQVQLSDSDFADTGFGVNHHVDRELFTSSSLPDKRIGLDPSFLTSTKTSDHVNPERFSNIMLALITALILLGDLSKADSLWMAGLFFKGAYSEWHGIFYCFILLPISFHWLASGVYALFVAFCFVASC